MESFVAVESVSVDLEGPVQTYPPDLNGTVTSPLTEFVLFPPPHQFPSRTKDNTSFLITTNLQ